MDMMKKLWKIFTVIVWIIIFVWCAWFTISYIWVLFTNLNGGNLPHWNFFYNAIH